MRILSTCLLSAVLAGTSACSSESSDQGTGFALAGNTAESGSGGQGAPRFQSLVEGLAITATTGIPVFERGQAGQLCFDPSPKSPEARSVQAKGWQVTGEAEAGGYLLVSFVGTMEQGTSGSCLLGEGNIALFRGGDVQAIAHAAEGTTLSIAYIQPLESGDIRILDGDFLTQPVADMRFGANGSVRIEKLAASERVCNGGGQVPNIHGLPINRARAMLTEAGWEPSPARPAGGRADGRASALADRGLIEVDDCSGTGFGYCAFVYEGKAGILTVITAGDDEWPTVARYSADCSR